MNAEPTSYGDLLVELIIEVSSLRRQAAVLVEGTVQAAIDRDAFRLVAVHALHHGHDLHEQLQRCHEQIERLRDETRQLRAAFMLRQEAA